MHDRKSEFVVLIEMYKYDPVCADRSSPGYLVLFSNDIPHFRL